MVQNRASSGFVSSTITNWGPSSGVLFRFLPTQVRLVGPKALAVDGRSSKTCHVLLVRHLLGS